MLITLDNNLKERIPTLRLGWVTATASVGVASPEQQAEFQRALRSFADCTPLDSIAGVPEIRAAREASRVLGRDPNRYRASAEALLRRSVKRQPIRSINNVVDVNNLISLQYALPVGSYNMGVINGQVTLRVGHISERYAGVTKGDVELEGMLVLCDSIGPFGSPAGDSARAPISVTTERIIVVLFSLNESTDLEEALSTTELALRRYASATSIQRGTT